jgi:nucleoside-diphosphate-sugar epimerase
MLRGPEEHLMPPLDRPTHPPQTVLIAGAGGFLGQSLVRAFSAAGYGVRGLVQNPSGTQKVLAAGGTPVIGDVLDPEEVRRAMTGCSAAVQVAATYPENPAEADRARRVRVDGTRNLAAAARAVGARRLVVGSGYWVYADQPGIVKDDSPLDPRGESRVNREAEEVGLESNEPGRLDVLIVRPGMVYGDGSWFRGMVDRIRGAEYQVPGAGENFWSLVEREDVGEAFRTILEMGGGGEAYLVVDDAPIPLHELVALIAQQLEVSVPGAISLPELERSVGPDVAHHLAANRAGSNEKLRRLGWVPHYPDCRVGVPLAVQSMMGDLPP